MIAETNHQHLSAAIEEATGFDWQNESVHGVMSISIGQHVKHFRRDSNGKKDALLRKLVVWRP